jgi:hypothetical protein
MTIYTSVACLYYLNDYFKYKYGCKDAVEIPKNLKTIVIFSFIAKKKIVNKYKMINKNK